MAIKRSSDALGELASSSKRQKTTTNFDKRLRLKYRQQGAQALIDNPQDSSIIDRELNRTLCIALYGTGFNAVKSSALESFRAIVHEYMLHFSLRVRSSMLNSRRSQPVPQDFAFALAQFGLAPADLLPEHDLKVPARISQAPILPAAMDTLPRVFETDLFLSSNDKSTADQRRRPYIPHHLPTFPSQHTYQETPVYAARETDALRVRERATQEGAQAEQALRKLLAANKGGDRNRRAGVRRRPPDVDKRSEELFQAALQSLAQKDAAARKSAGGDADMAVSRVLQDEADDDDLSTAANYDRLFWRRGKGRQGLLTR